MPWSALAALELQIEEVELTGLELATKSGWTRRSTVVRLRGGGLEGAGEDVTYAAEEQLEFQDAGHERLRPLRGAALSLAEFCALAAELELFPQDPAQPASRRYRRWALESAALDLALRQAGLGLPAALGRQPSPVRYVVSLGLGPGGSAEPLRRLRGAFPEIGFKLDWDPEWTQDTLRDLAELGGVEVVDFKGHYRGAFRGPPADPDGYRLVAEALPGAVLEDPVAEGPAWEALADHRARIAWDAPLYRLADLRRLPRPGRVNLKPSRFGGLEELVATIAWCEAEGLPLYGGGQFELGPGRRHIQQLAALLHPDAPNDVSPAAFHSGLPEPGTPPSPLPWEELRGGFPG